MEGRAVREAHPDERAYGIDYYASDADGVGGRLRDRPADFRVTEREAFDTEPVDADPGAYPDLVFRATLERWDTNDFAGSLSDRLGISRERVSWAGTKDKHAITTQLFAVKGWDGEPTLPEMPRAELELVGRAGRPVLFGDLLGNAFEIVVRDPEGPENAAAITADLQALAGSDGDGPIGVPNWFGQQRFGTLRPVTHEVGLAIAREDWEGAVMAYLGGPSEREPEETRAARTYVEETRDWQGGLDRLPHRLGYERAICHRLVENGGDQPEHFRNALEAVPTNLQSLFVNGAQSYLYNRMLSERLARGLPFDRPVAGDVVCFTDEHGIPDPDRLQRVDGRRVDVVTRHCERGRAYVTAPLVGTESELADGEQGDIERAVLDEAGVEPGDFALPGEFDSTGTRRAILVRTAMDVTEGEDALTFAFELPKGAYATTVLREYMKVPPAAMD